MPLLDDDTQPLKQTQTLPATPVGSFVEEYLNQPNEEERPSLLGAAFRQENLIASAVDGFRPAFKEDPDHNPLDVIQDTIYEQEFSDNFVGSRSEDETRYIMGKIDRELKDRERLAEGGWASVGLGILAGTLDPTVLIPFGGAVNVGKGIKTGVSIGRTVTKTAALTGAVVAGQEAGLQYSQEIRPWEESALSIGTGTLLGGFLGGAMGYLSKKQLANLTAKMDDIRQAGRVVLDEESVGRIAAGADAGAAVARRGGSGEIIGGKAIKRTGMAELSPVTRLQTSQFEEARQTVRDLSDAGLMLSENKQGIATSAGGTVQTRVTMWNGGLADAVQTMDDAYARYWYGRPVAGGRVRARVSSEVARYTGRINGKLTARAFRQEVGKAMARGDTHAIPEVAEVASAMRRSVFDPLKNAAIRVGLLDKNVKAVGAESYITRMYNREKIVARRNEFRDILFRHFRTQSDVQDMIDAEVYDLVDGVIDTITGSSPFRMPGIDIVQGPRGPLKERVLNIADEKIEEFLERDIETVARFYVRSMAPDVELTAKFGDVQMSEPLRKLLDERNRRMAAATTDKQRKTINAQYDTARRDLEALRDRTRGIYGLPKDAGTFTHRAGKVAQNLNYLRLLGGMTLTAIPDLARPVMVYGLNRTFSKGWLPLVTSFKTHRLAAAEVKKAGTALDMVLDTRARAVADLFEDWQRGTVLERAIEGATSKFGLVSLMSPWNAVMKQITGTIAMDGFLRAAQAVNLGKATKRQITDLAAAGIDETMARRIWAQFDAGGGVKQGGLYLSNTEDWTDRAAVEAFRAAIVRDADRVIVTPGLEKPLFMSKSWGRIMGQFKSFAFSSVQRTLLAGLQRPDAAFINGAILSVALGGLGTWIRAETSGFDTSKWSNAKWATEAVDRSGLLTIFSEINNIAEKFSRGRVGLSAFTGEMATRYQSRNLTSSFLGPTVGLAEDVGQISGSIFADDWRQSDTHKVRQLLPYQNLFYIRRLLDQIEEGANEAMGVPVTRR